MNPAPIAFPSSYDSGLAAIRNGQQLIASSGADLVSLMSGGPSAGGWPADSSMIGQALLDASMAGALEGSDDAQGVADFFRGKAQVEAGIAVIAAANHNAQIVIDLIDPDRNKHCPWCE